jgi:methyl-accepting chemotaxis protein
MSRRLAALGFSLLAFALAGCGGSDEESASTTSAAETQAAYADGLCNSLSSWTTSLQSVGSELKGGQNLTKDSIESAANKVSDANQNLADDLDALGKPPEIAGPEVRSAVDDLKSELEKSADQIKDAADGISNVQDALNAVGVASSALIAMSTAMSSTITKLQGLDVAQGWKQAFENSSSCQSLGNS